MLLFGYKSMLLFGNNKIFLKEFLSKMLILLKIIFSDCSFRYFCDGIFKKNNSKFNTKNKKYHAKFQRLT